MTQSFSHAHQLRTWLVVLSDRRPAPGSPRTGVELGIEWALREHDGIWLSWREEEDSCNGEWSVLAGAPARSRASMAHWADYVRANGSYAERIIEMVSPDGAVWINGHRWLLVASALRKHGHRGPIGLLLDVPFPDRARLEALPWMSDVMAALGQLDLFCFQSQECADNFEACRMENGRSRPWSAIIPNLVKSAPCTSPAEWVAGFFTLLASAAHRETRKATIA